MLECTLQVKNPKNCILQLTSINGRSSNEALFRRKQIKSKKENMRILRGSFFIMNKIFVSGRKAKVDETD